MDSHNDLKRQIKFGVDSMVCGGLPTGDYTHQNTDARSQTKYFRKHSPSGPRCCERRSSGLANSMPSSSATLQR